MELTQRQLATYKLIEKNTSENKITTQYEIYSNYPKETYIDGYSWTAKNTHDHCPQVRNDIEALNKTQVIERLVIMKDFTYKLATSKEEALEYSKKYMHEACRKLERYWNIVRKVQHDGQGKIDFVNSVATEFINTYGKETNN